MNTSSHVVLPIATQSRSLNWKCGDINMGRGGFEQIQEGALVDWSRNGLDLSVAYEQVNIIVSTTLNSLQAIRKMVGHTVAVAHELAFVPDFGCATKKATEIEGLLEQVGSIVSETSLGAINLLGQQDGCLSIPYLMTEIQDAEEFYSFVTMGISISPVREEVSGTGDKLVGLYVLSTALENSVCWVSSPKFWLETLTTQSGEWWNQVEIIQESEQLVLRLSQFDLFLSTLEDQLSQYIKMVGEVITDPVLENQ